MGSPTGHAAPIFRDMFALTLLRVDAQEREGDEELHLCKLRRVLLSSWPDILADMLVELQEEYFGADWKENALGRVPQARGRLPQHVWPPFRMKNEMNTKIRKKKLTRTTTPRGRGTASAPCGPACIH